MQQFIVTEPRPKTPQRVSGAPKMLWQQKAKDLYIRRQRQLKQRMRMQALNKL